MVPGLPANLLLDGRRLVRKFAVVAAVLAAVSISACKKTAPGEYEVQTPVIGTQTDTIHTPTVQVGTGSFVMSTSFPCRMFSLHGPSLTIRGAIGFPSA